MSVPIRDLRNNSAAVIGRVSRGERVVVTKDGDPVCAVVPLPRQRLTAEELVQRWRGVTGFDHGEFRSDLDEILDPTL